MAAHIYVLCGSKHMSRILGITNTFYETLLQKLTIPANIMQKQDEELDHAIALSLLDDDHKVQASLLCWLDHVHMSVSSFYI